MRWSPILKVCKIKDAGQPHLSHHQWNEINEMSVEKWWNEICGRGKGEKLGRKPTQSPFCPSRNTRAVTEKWTRNPSGGRRATNRLSHRATLLCACIGRQWLGVYWRKCDREVFQNIIRQHLHTSTEKLEIRRTLNCYQFQFPEHKAYFVKGWILYSVERISKPRPKPN